LVGADWSDVLREPRIAQECPNHGAKAPLLEQCWILFSARRGACPFLGDDQKCGIYPTRPNSCVAFAAGSAKCQELRIDAGLRPLTPVAGQDLLDQINAAEIEYDRENDE
jgi:Fe-S-cluster containining protein